MGIIIFDDQPDQTEISDAIVILRRVFPNTLLRGVSNLFDFKNILMSWEEKGITPKLFILDIMIANSSDLSVLNVKHSFLTAQGFDTGLLLAKEYLRGLEKDKYGEVPIIFFTSREMTSLDGQKNSIFAQLDAERPNSVQWLNKNRLSPASGVFEDAVRSLNVSTE